MSEPAPIPRTMEPRSFTWLARLQKKGGPVIKLEGVIQNCADGPSAVAEVLAIIRTEHGEGHDCKVQVPNPEAG